MDRNAEQVNAGAKFSVKWTGPNNPRDFITIVQAGTADKQYDAYEYTSQGNPVQLTAPDKPGDYEVRYLTAQTYATLGVTKVTVTRVSASLQAPAEAVAGTSFAVTWKGPNNTHDYVTIVAKGAKEGVSGNYAYTAQRGNPAQVLAPIVPGDYELRYSTGQSHATLATTAIRITPGKQEPGYVSVSTASSLATGTGVEIILDASGSMLQRLGGQRRIDIAKQTLTSLTDQEHSGGHAVRVASVRSRGRFLPDGSRDSACAARTAAVTAASRRSKRRTTPRHRSARRSKKAIDDLKTVRGERLVILLTDGEETCGGDPAAAIEKLKAAGVTVRVNIVGFAIDDAKLATTFRHWASAGNGMFFDAKDAAGLGKALADSLQARLRNHRRQGAGGRGRYCRRRAPRSFRPATTPPAFVGSARRSSPSR